MIELQKVCRTFIVGDQQVAALRDVNLRVDAGEYISIMGPSGSGKSTMLNMLGLLDRPTSGTYLLDGGDVTALNDEQQARVRREKIGFVFQSFHLVPRLTAAQNVELPMILAGIPSEERKSRVQVLMQNYGLSDRADHKPDQLSGGQRQRVGIARAILAKPKILIFDEATSNLDSYSEKLIQEAMERVSQRRTVIIIAHRLSTIRHADQIFVLEGGKIIEQGSHEELSNVRGGLYAKLLKLQNTGDID